MLFWALPAVLLLRLPALRRAEQGLSLATVAALFVLVAVSSVWIFPEYTLDQTTVHRALLVVEAPAACWLAALLAEPVRAHPASSGVGQPVGREGAGYP
jgi:hypothetical protein